MTDILTFQRFEKWESNSNAVTYPITAFT